MQLVASGYTSGQIARRLGITEQCVNLRVAKFCEVVGAKNRAHAVAIALCRGFIRTDVVEVPTVIDRPKPRRLAGKPFIRKGQTYLSAYGRWADDPHRIMILDYVIREKRVYVCTVPVGVENPDPDRDGSNMRWLYSDYLHEHAETSTGRQRTTGYVLEKK
jgi:hypothetical protein